MTISASERMAQHLAAIVSSSDDAIISKDLNGTILSWNRAAERMFGYTADEAIGRSGRLIIPEDIQDEEDDVLRRIRKGESVTHFETRRVRKDGSVIPVSLTVSPILDDDGHVIGASKIARDISDRKRREAQLAASETARGITEQARAELQERLLALVVASKQLFATPRLRVVLDSAMRIGHDLVAADAYAIWRVREGKWHPLACDGVSAEFASVASARRTTDTGAQVETEATEPLAIEDVQAWSVGMERHQAYLDEGIVSMLAIPMVLHGLRQGTFVFYHRMPHRYSDVDVNVARALGNLTAAAMTNAELFDEHRRTVRAGVLSDVLRRLSASLDPEEIASEIVAVMVPRVADWCAVDLVDKDGKPERLAAAHVDESKGAIVNELRQRFPNTEATPGAPGSVIAAGQSVHVPEITDDMLAAVFKDNDEQLRLIRALGVASYMCVPLLGKHGVMGAISFVLGKSERRFAEDDFRLAHELADRTAFAIESARAYQAAQRANRLKDTFLATLSHELRTPLNAILGYTRMLRTGAVAEDRRGHAFESLERNANMLSQMIHDLLDVSRVASGKLILTMQPIGLRRLVLESVESVQPSASDKGLHLDVRSDDDPLPIEGDRVRLQQVFWNLLTNAVKFTPAGGHVSVTVKRGEDGAIVTVRDSGIGIPPASHASIFEPFQQVSSRSTRDAGGLGLGLAIVREIVEMHGGTVAVESEGEDKGSAFTVRLPRRVTPRAVSHRSVPTDRTNLP